MRRCGPRCAFLPAAFGPASGSIGTPRCASNSRASASASAGGVPVSTNPRNSASPALESPAGVGTGASATRTLRGEALAPRAEVERPRLRERRLGALSRGDRGVERRLCRRAELPGLTRGGAEWHALAQRRGSGLLGRGQRPAWRAAAPSGRRGLAERTDLAHPDDRSEALCAEAPCRPGVVAGRRVGDRASAVRPWPPSRSPALARRRRRRSAPRRRDPPHRVRACRDCRCRS